MAQSGNGSDELPQPHLISIVIPVYRGERDLPGLVAEIALLAQGFTTPAGRSARIVETLLVHDRGPDNSDRVIRELAERYEFVRPVWFSRNFGQHPATLAGIASSGGEWIATIDEDGQYDPNQIGVLLDAAMDAGASLVYADPINPAPHSWFRNITSRMSKRMVDAITGGHDARKFHSFRLVLGEVGRSVAAFAGPGVYLDVALSWVAGPAATAKVQLRDEGDHKSGYNLRRLLSHFWRMVLTSGTRALRLVSVVGAIVALVGVGIAIYTLVSALTGGAFPAGWASQLIVTLLLGGAILMSLGIVAEYIGVVVGLAMGRPPYLIVSDPAAGPLGRELGTHADVVAENADRDRSDRNCTDQPEP